MAGATQGEMANPMQARVNAIAAILEAQSMGMKRIQSAIDADPKLRELANGWWEYFELDKNPRPTYGCAAAYISLSGVVLLSESIGYKEAVITFLGASIPRPNSPAKITALLDQDDGQPKKSKRSVMQFEAVTS